MTRGCTTGWARTTMNTAIEAGLAPGERRDRYLAEERVILVDADDRPIGGTGKLVAHQKNLRHRAISVIIFDREGRMLLQQRAASKYHSAGLWANACCSHPRPQETAAAAAARRLPEEMGFRAPLSFIGLFPYQAQVGQGLWENEIVHVFTGVHDGDVMPNPDEVQDFRWCGLEAIHADIAARPEDFTAWFRLYSRAPWFGRPV